MNRCVFSCSCPQPSCGLRCPTPGGRRRLLSLAAATLAGAALGLPAAAQTIVSRRFPAEALRGVLQIGDAPEALLNGQPARLAPGARLRGPDNMLVMSAAVAGQRLAVNFTVDMLGLIMDVWILRPDELSLFWPRTRAEAARHEFDPVAQTWTRRPS